MSLRAAISSTMRGVVRRFISRRVVMPVQPGVSDEMISFLVQITGIHTAQVLI